jgi:hypothetical protein
MIEPSVGRVVLYYPSKFGSDDEMAKIIYQPLAAIICSVDSNSCVNLAVFDTNGTLHSRTSVFLLQDDDAVPAHGRYCEWMPYQKGQAAKTEELEHELKLKNHGIDIG